MTTKSEQTRRRPPLLIPGVLWGCFWGGAALSFVSGPVGHAGGLLALAPLAAMGWAVGASLWRR